MIRTIVKAGLFVLATVVLDGIRPPAAAAADDWQAGAGPDWQKVLTAGRAEGKVAVSAIAGTLGKPMAEGFKRDTGIDLDFLGGTVSELTTRLVREAKSDNVTIDVAIGGGTEMVTLYPHGLLQPVKPQLLLPHVTEGKYWEGGKIKWMDNAGEYFLQPVEFVSGRPVVNSDMIDPKTITSWQDFLKPEYKGKIAAYDPRPGGPGQALATYLVHTFGVDFLKKLYVGQEVTYTRDGRQLVEFAVRGKYPIILAAVQFNVEWFRDQGIKNIATLDLLDGAGNVLGGFGVIKQLKNVPHPNAATVFINWIASKPGQEIYAKAMLEKSRRTDVDVNLVPDYVVPKPGVKYLDQYDEDFYVKERPKIAKQVIEALGGR